MTTGSKAVTLGIAAIFIIVGVAVPSLALQKANPSKRPGGGDKSAEQPYTFERLLRNLDSAKRPGTFVDIPMIITNVRKYGVAFQPTQEQIEAMRKKGATEDLIKAVKEKAGILEPTPTPASPPPPPPPPLLEGRLTVTCKPVDCIVFANEKPIGTTTKGELKDRVLPVGNVKVSVASENYVPDKQGQAIEIIENAPVHLEFVFKPTPAALRAKGNALFEGMIAALGGEPALKEARFFRARGDLDLFDQANNKTTWPFLAVIRLPGVARFEVSKSNKKYTIEGTELGFSWKGGKELPDLVDGFRYLIDNHITGLVDRLGGPRAKAETEKLHFEPGEDVVFRVEREAYKYRVTLNSEARPKEITLETGLNSGLKVLLSKYQKQGAAYIPMITEVVLPGAGMHGIIVRYESMELNPSEEKGKPKKGFSGRGR